MSEKRQLSVCGAIAQPSSLALKTVAKLDQHETELQIKQIHGRVYASFQKANFLWHNITLADINAVNGMGLAYNSRLRHSVLHIDMDYLDRILPRVPKVHHQSAAAHFALSSAGYTIVKDAPQLTRARKEDAQCGMMAAWKWASYLALENLGLKPVAEHKILEAHKSEERLLSQQLGDSIMKVIGITTERGIPTPHFRGIPPWAAVGYPSEFGVTNYKGPTFLPNPVT